jgi:hypothetical protein
MGKYVFAIVLLVYRRTTVEVPQLHAVRKELLAGCAQNGGAGCGDRAG